MERSEERPESEALFRAFFDQGAVGMAQVDLDGRWLRFNRTLCDMVGYTREEMAGKSFQDITHPEDLESDLSQVRDLLEGRGRTYILEKRYLHKDGRTVWVNLTVSLERDAASGRPLWFVAIIQEITARKRAEAALREKEAFLESIYQGVEEAIFVVDVAPDGGMAFAGFNPSYLRLAGALGLDAAPMLGRPVPELARHIPPEAAAAVEANYRRCAGTRQAVQYEEQAMLSGRLTHFITRLTPLLDAEGRVYRIVGTSLDVTALKESEAKARQAEDHLRQAQKMEAVGRLAGGIAHDFNNLLTAINGYGDLLLAAMPPGDAEREFVQEIRKAGERASSLTQQLLAFSRKQVLAPKEVDLSAIVSDMGTLLRRLIGDDIALDIRAARGLEPVLADRGQLEQVILNLALNARDAMPGGGSLQLRTAMEDVPGGRAAILSVTDTGKGMDETVRARIFEPFFTTKAPGQGTGLGLSMVYGIVTQSGGRIEVESGPGRGSTFRVILPAVARGAEPPPEADSAGGASSRGRETILVAEDEDALRRLIVRILSDRGYTVLAARDGVEALEMAERAGTLHLLLTDVVMARMGGRELAERLLAGRPDLGVVYMSGYTDDTVLRHGVLQAKARFLQKPFTPGSLLTAIREELDSRRSAQP